METRIIIAGAGGQGVLFSGDVIAQAAMESGNHTACFPSYGAEIRGGTSMSSVIVSDSPIGSPVASYFDCLLMLNEMGFNRYIKRSLPESKIIINSSLFTVMPDDKRVYAVPASEIASTELNNILAANMILVGCFARISGIIGLNFFQSACDTLLKTRKSIALLNKKALEIGYSYQEKLWRK